jgi:hypothetical protein
MKEDRKTYAFNGAAFQLKPNDLELLKDASPLILKHRKLVHEYTKDIDMSEAERFKDRIRELETAIKQLEETGPVDGTEPVPCKQGQFDPIPAVMAQNRIDLLRDKLNEVKAEFENNYKVQSLIKLHNECEGSALMELVTDAEFMKPFLKKILLPVNDSDIDKIDFEDIAVVGFVKEVVMDFFSIITGNSSIFKT